MTLLNALRNTTQQHDFPYRHWLVGSPLDNETLAEMVKTPIPEGRRAYDGTRAADNGGHGVDGKLRDEVFKVFDGENTLGRLETAEVYLGEGDVRVSREHAQIIHREGAFGLKPLKEDNPTFLNGNLVEGGAPLSDGDEIGLGDSKLRFRVV